MQAPNGFQGGQCLPQLRSKRQTKSWAIMKFEFRCLAANAFLFHHHSLVVQAAPVYKQCCEQWPLKMHQGYCRKQKAGLAEHNISRHTLLRPQQFEGDGALV
eukprot:1159378-Pelagomonas_calceolata.AAC.5